MPRPYSMCSEGECRDRQADMEVSEWEATSDTFHMSPKERIIDPSLAMSKYRRSAAGTNQRTPRRVVQLIQTWEHLRGIFVHQKIHESQPPRALAATVSFLDDRIRAIQVDFVVSQRTSCSSNSSATTSLRSTCSRESPAPFMNQNLPRWHSLQLSWRTGTMAQILRNNPSITITISMMKSYATQPCVMWQPR